MNLVLLFQEDFTKKNTVRLTGRRFAHIREVLRSRTGDMICVGLEGGKIGQGKITSLDKESVELTVKLNQPPPKPFNAILICALPRPNVVKRVLISAASLGIKKIIFLNFNRVEKSLWQSSSLRPEEIREQLILGLEQAKDTIMPEVLLRPRFKPFVQDELPQISHKTAKIVAHPEGKTVKKLSSKKALTLIIGPEGGLIPYEIEQLNRAGFKAVSFGERILRVETVIPYIFGKMY